LAEYVVTHLLVADHMQKIELHTALTDVVVALTGREREDVIARLGSDYEDPTLWKRPSRKQTQASDKDLMYARLYQRTHTRKSRFTERLYREAASVPVETRLPTVPDVPVITCYHDMIVAVRLIAAGHYEKALVIVKRCIRRATELNEPLAVLQALHLADGLQGAEASASARRQHQRHIRRWSDRYFQQRSIAAFLEDILVDRRNREQSSLLEHIDAAWNDLQFQQVPLTKNAERLLSSVVKIRRHQVAGHNQMIINTVASVLRRFSASIPDGCRWLTGWLVCARMRAQVALDLELEARSEYDVSTTTYLLRPHLKCEACRLQLMSCMRRGQWDAAAAKLVELRQMNEVASDEYERQRMLLIEGYFWISRQLGMHTHSVVDRMPRITTFLNSVSQISQDQSGLNIQIAVYEILYYLVQGQVDVVERKVFNLTVRASRNLRFPAADPHRAFITMLRVVSHYDITDPKVRARTKRYIHRMEHDSGEIPEHLLFPLPLRDMAQAIIRFIIEKGLQTSV